MNSSIAKWFAEADANHYPAYTVPALRAPELILQSGYDAKIDIWALGCLVRNPHYESWHIAHKLRCAHLGVRVTDRTPAFHPDTCLGDCNRRTSPRINAIAHWGVV